MTSLSTLSLQTKTLAALAVVGLMSVVSLAAVVIVLVRLPATYFLEEYAPPVQRSHPAVRWIALAVKNVLGAVLVVVGLLMSLPGVPGQGLLTILIGLMLINFPGKRRLERRLISQPRIFASVNRLRQRFGRPALRLE